MNTQEKIQKIILSSKAIEQETLGYISAQRWRDLKSGRVIHANLVELEYIDFLLKNQKRVNDMFKKKEIEK